MSIPTMASSSMRRILLRQATASQRLLSSAASRSQQASERPTVDSSPSDEAQSRMAGQSSASGSASTSESSSNTHFGFRDVLEDDKIGLVGGVFSSVAASYDVMNDAMSLGIHRLWKDQFVKQLDPRGGIKCLDVAGGTGDIANRILDHARTRHGDRNCHVTILDINAKMLKAGQKRMKQTMYWNTPQLAFQLGNAEDLNTSTPPSFESSAPAKAESGSAKQRLPPNTSPLPPLPTVPIADNSIDLYTIAFGIRNCTHIDKVLSEAYRVLKPGGIFACLEFGKTAGFHLAGSPEASEWGLTDLGGRSSSAEDAEINGSWQDLTLGIASIWHGIKL